MILDQIRLRGSPASCASLYGFKWILIKLHSIWGYIQNVLKAQIETVVVVCIYM